MAQTVSALDEAIAHLDSLIAKLQSVPPPPPTTPVIVPPVVQGRRDTAKVESQESIDTAAAAAADVEKKPIPDIFKDRKKPLKLPGGGAGVAAGPPLSSKSEHSENFDKALIQVGLVLSVSDHPISEKLYVCKVEVAPGETRQVVAGLKKFVHEHELERRKVCVILNLKPAKLAGQVSEAMILAGSVPTPDGSEIVKVLEPPLEASIGDRIFLENEAPSFSPAKQLSSKIWEKIVPLLIVKDGLATFNHLPLVTSAGVVKVPGLPDGAGIH